MKPVIIFRGIVVHNDKILLCKSNKRGYNFLPGGHVEERESVESAFIREMTEEIGKKVIDTKKITDISNSYYEDDKLHTETVHVYLASLESYSEIQSLEKHISFAWVPL